MNERPAARIRILVADDHPILREGLRRLLEAEPDFCVVGEAADGADALRLAQALQPDILILDLSMPKGVSGLETLRELGGLATPVRTIVLAAIIENEQIVEALKLGARGVVLKETATELLFKAIRKVMAGQYWVGMESVADLVESLRRLVAPSGAALQKPFGLSARELEIVAAAVAGHSNREIARKLSLSEETVKHHLTHIFDKLGVSNRVELVLFAVRQRLVANT